MSSGQLAYEYDDIRFCGADDCEFDGMVVMWADPETGQLGWDCPWCKFGHEEGLS